MHHTYSFLSSNLNECHGEAPHTLACSAAQSRSQLDSLEEQSVPCAVSDCLTYNHRYHVGAEWQRSSKNQL